MTQYCAVNVISIFVIRFSDHPVYYAINYTYYSSKILNTSTTIQNNTSKYIIYPSRLYLICVMRISVWSTLLKWLQLLFETVFISCWVWVLFWCVLCHNELAFAVPSTCVLLYIKYYNIYLLINLTIRSLMNTWF